MQKDISIIIPVYNAEKTIVATLESLELDKWTHSYEILLINDGSTDNSINEINAFIKNFKNIRIISQENGGVAKARNTGLRVAKGKFIYFSDADDIVHRAVLEKVIEIANQFSVDLVITDYETYDIVREKSDIFKLGIKENISYNRNDIVSIIFPKFFKGENEGLATLCNKLYVADIIETNHLMFTEWRTHGEDWEFNLEYFKCIKNFFILSETVYTYNLDGSQNYGKYSKTLGRCLIDSHEKRLNLNQEYVFFAKNSDEFIKLEIRFFYQMIKYLRLGQCAKKEKREFLKNKTVKKTLKRIIKIKNKHLSHYDISIRYKIGAILMSIGNYKLALKFI